jgi:hypothetical protein
VRYLGDENFKRLVNSRKPLFLICRPLLHGVVMSDTIVEQCASNPKADQLDRSLAEQNKYQSLLRELLEATAAIWWLQQEPGQRASKMRPVLAVSSGGWY